MKRLIFIFLWLSICASCWYQIHAENHVHPSSVNLWADAPDDLVGYEGYTYNISDLKMRYRIMNGNSNALKQSVKDFENRGWAEPLTGKNYWNTYGATLGKLRIFSQVFEAVSMGVSAGSGVNASRALAGRVNVNRVSTRTVNAIKANVEKNVFTVTKEGVVLPKGATIPKPFVENTKLPGRSYGIYDVNGKFQERLRIDASTPPGMKGPNRSHFHLNKGKHIFDSNKWPWWQKK